MSSYENLKVAQLRELCKAAGLPVSGRKADLIASLLVNDGRQVHTGSPDPDISVPDEVESPDDEVGENIIDVPSENNATGSLTSNSDAITALKLKLELARENRLTLEIKERMQMNMLPAQTGAASLVSDNIHDRELRGLLPKMSEIGRAHV